MIWSTGVDFLPFLIVRQEKWNAPCLYSGILDLGENIIYQKGKRSNSYVEDTNQAVDSKPVH